MLTKEMSQTIQLANEVCHPNDAWAMLNELVSEHTRQHKIRMLRKCESNHNFDPRPFDNNIQQMNTQCRDLKALMEEAKLLGLNVEIKASIEVKMARNHSTSSSN